jgi:nicotinate-nucleotide adenylyltransferase
MVRAAIESQPGFTVDDREVRRVGPSYTVTTLSELRAEFPAHPLVLVVGMDAFLGLPNWHQWREILQLAHVAVAHRPGWRAPTTGLLGDLLRQRGSVRMEDLHDALAGTSSCTRSRNSKFHHGPARHHRVEPRSGT